MVSRRSFLLGSAGALGALTLPRGARAEGPPEKSAVVLVWFNGSYNALFSAPDGYLPSGQFSCTPDTVRELAPGHFVDKVTLGALPAEVLGNLATVGVRHGFGDHISAPRQFWNQGQTSYPLLLAHAMGGSGSIRCARFGLPLAGLHAPVNGVAMTTVPDLSAAVNLYASGAPAEGPRRDLMARALKSALATSRPRYARSPNSLADTWGGHHALITALEQPPVGADWPELATAYGLDPANTSAATFASQLAGAELLVKAGVDVVIINSRGWDTHDDGLGVKSRERFVAELLGPLGTFLSRTRVMAGHNVTTALFGEFARTNGQATGDSGHAKFTSASVFGKHVRAGTTGRVVPVRSSLGLAEGTPGTPGFWAYLAAMARAPQQPFGANPHLALG